MSNLYWLSEDQMARLRPYFPKSHGVPRVDDRRVLNEIIFINRNGLRWCDAPKEYGPSRHFTIVGSGGVTWVYLLGSWWGSQPKSLTTIRYQSTQLISKLIAQHPACVPKRCCRFLMERINGGLNTKSHAVTDTVGRPIQFFMTAGQVSNYTGAHAFASSLPAADWLLREPRV